MRVLHWFRSDLRMHDNTALLSAAPHAEAMAFVFVFDESLLASERHGAPRVRFMRACLERLSKSLAERGHTLLIRTGDPRVELPKLAQQLGVRVVTWNRDYSPYAKARDAAVEEALGRHDIAVRRFKDRVVWESSEVRTKTGGAYSVYTPYKNAWWRGLEEEGLRPPGRLTLPGPIPGRIAKGALPSERALDIAGDPTELPTPGEDAALRRLRAFLEHSSADYDTLRDFPAAEATSRLSPYLRFGVISVRRCVAEGQSWLDEGPHAEKGVAKWLDELVWRDFYHGILDENPHVSRGNYRPEYDALQWAEDEAGFEAWCAGETGFPFVDAAMRELNHSGFMHNRARMVVASFLTKDLGIDWRRGEHYFMQRLVDGDPASNNGGWQWAASTGTDAQPYFRIFNPVSQGERFDPKGDYTRKWVPELAGLDGARIHQPWKAPLEAQGYPERILDHGERREASLERFKRARGRGKAAKR